MTGAEYMTSIQQTVREIRLLNEQIERYNHLATEVRSSVFPTDRVQTSRRHDRMVDAVLDIVKAKEALKQRIATLQAYEKEVGQLLLQLREESERILVYRYFEDMSFEGIAVELGYSKGRIYDLHKIALDQLTDLLNRSGK